jgi:hypothetical protein
MDVHWKLCPSPSHWRPQVDTSSWPTSKLKAHAHTPTTSHATLQIWEAQACTAHANGHANTDKIAIATPVRVPSGASPSLQHVESDIVRLPWLHGCMLLATETCLLGGNGVKRRHVWRLLSWWKQHVYRLDIILQRFATRFE